VPLRKNDPRRAARCYLGDCLAVLPTLPAESVDAVVTDPPAGIAFMGKEFDDPARYQSRREKFRDRFLDLLTPRLAECLRVLKPGGYALVWALPRTSHWTGTAVEDAGFEVREKVYHLFGQGMPKGKACLKPAAEEWILARKPGPRVLPLNIERSRVRVDGARPLRLSRPNGTSGNSLSGSLDASLNGSVAVGTTSAGRYPANVCLSCDCPEGDGHGSDCPVALLDAQAGERKSNGRRVSDSKMFACRSQPEVETGYGDSGGPSRYFYVAKASKADRGEGNRHPCVKSQALMKWLIGLVSFPGDTVLDPFMGSGTTGVACVQTGRRFVGVELDPEYHAIATRRIAQAEAEALASGTSTKE
jgi:hypothetical protein